MIGFVKKIKESLNRIQVLPSLKKSIEYKSLINSQKNTFFWGKNDSNPQTKPEDPQMERFKRLNQEFKLAKESKQFEVNMTKKKIALRKRENKTH